MIDKTKTLPSSYREKKRYLIFEILAEEEVGFEELIKAIYNSAISLTGVLRFAKTNFKFINDLYDRNKHTFVIRCLPTDVEVMRLAMALISEIDGKTICIRSLGISGTIKSASSKYLE